MVTWGDAIQIGVVWVVGGGDAGHVRAVAARVRHNGQHAAVVVNVDAEVQRVLITAAATRPLRTKAALHVAHAQAHSH